MPSSSKSSKSSKHRHISKVRLNKKAKNIKTQRHKKNRKTRIVQRGGFNDLIKAYYSSLNNQVNTYDLKLMLIYTYLNKPGLSDDEKDFIEECMKIKSFGLFDGIDILTREQSFNKISTLLGLTITGVISMDAEGRKEDRNWYIWLSMKNRNRLPLPSFLLTEIDIDNIKIIFNENGTIMPSKTLYVLKPKDYIKTANGVKVNITTGNELYGNGNKFYGGPRGKSNKSAAARRPTTLAAAAPAAARRPTAPAAEEASNGWVHLPQPAREASAPILPLTHFWFKAWPDHGAPDITQYCNFIKEIYNHILEFGGGSIIHCSAGVGRTGVVYITLNLLFEFGINPKYGFPLTETHVGITKAKIKETIMNSRHYRMMLVQKIEQYNFIVQCFCANSTVDHSTIKDEDIIRQTNPGEYTTRIAQQPANINKNRYSNVFPYDEKANRVDMVKTLQTDVNQTGYINASFAPCFTPPRPTPANWNCPDFILSQCPINDTILDFQNMIRLHNIRRIIMVTGLVEKGIIKCDDYLAFNTQLKPDSINIVKKFTLYEPTPNEYGQIREYKYTQLDSRERAGSSSNA